MKQKQPLSEKKLSQAKAYVTMCQKFATALSALFRGKSHLIFFMVLLNACDNPYSTSITHLLNCFQKLYSKTIHELMTCDKKDYFWTFVNKYMPTQLGNWRDVLSRFYAICLKSDKPIEESVATISWGIGRKYPDLAREAVLWESVTRLVHNRRHVRWTNCVLKKAIWILWLGIYVKSREQIIPLRRLARWCTRVNLKHIQAFLIYTPVASKLF